MSGFGKLPLMIVEDDVHFRFLMDVAAKRSGLFEPVTLAADGQPALEMLRAADVAQLPALIVSDLSMPRMTGLELLRALKSDAALQAIPVAIMTSSDTPNDRELALAGGACSFVPKPYSLDELTSALVTLGEMCRETARTVSSVRASD